MPGPQIVDPFDQRRIVEQIKSQLEADPGAELTLEEVTARRIIAYFPLAVDSVANIAIYGSTEKNRLTASIRLAEWAMSLTKTGAEDPLQAMMRKMVTETNRTKAQMELEGRDPLDG